jgi:ADP-heptose:LPS heptosyltransferase
MTPVTNILVIRLTAMGDVVLTLPAVSVLRQNFPKAKLTFLTTLENSPLLQGFPEVNETITLDRAAFRSGHPARIAGELFRVVRRLRAGKFSLAVDLHGNGESAWLTRLSGASQRWRQFYRTGRGWAYTRQIESRSDVHPAAAHLYLLQQCGLNPSPVRNDFVLPDAALSDARAWLAAHRLEPAKPTIFIQPFTSGAHKNWPLENYLAIARYWQSAGRQIIFGGGPGDRAALEPARHEGFAVSAGVPLLVTGGLLQFSALVLGGDTGVLHLAVALGRRVLMVMYLASPRCPVPFQHPDWTVVAPQPGTIADLSVAEVLAATRAAL